MATKPIEKGIAHFKKYTLQPKGIYKLINKFFAVDPNRSTGIPLNSTFRIPSPGANDPLSYTDPVTIPAGDIAENAYYKRDTRRKYPQLSVITQGDVVGLLSLGSKTHPREDILKIGEEGKKQIVAVREKDKEGGGLGMYLMQESGREGNGIAKRVLGENGLPPMPPSRWEDSTKEKRYELSSDHDQAYGVGKYTCRTFV